MADSTASNKFRFPGLIPDVRLRAGCVALLKPDPAALPLHCVNCGGAVTVQMSSWPTALTIPELDKSPWNCPYCQQENPGGFPGQIAWVHKGHGDGPTV